MAEVARLKAEAPALEAAQGEAGRRTLEDRLAAIPNRPNRSCPRAPTSTATSSTGAFEAKRPQLATGRQHFEIGEPRG